MSSKPKWVLWARATLLCAISGHWIANAFLDRDQYSQAGLAYSWDASLPILVQTILVLSIAIALGPLSAGCTPTAFSGWRFPRRMFALVTSQLVLFLVLEISERVVQREPFTEGLLASGFSMELLFAIGSALLLALLGSLALDVIRSVGRKAVARAIEDRIEPRFRPVIPARSVVAVCHGRAPPLVVA